MCQALDTWPHYREPNSHCKQVCLYSLYCCSVCSRRATCQFAPVAGGASCRHLLPAFAGHHQLSISTIHPNNNHTSTHTRPVQHHFALRRALITSFAPQQACGRAQLAWLWSWQSLLSVRPWVSCTGPQPPPSPLLAQPNARPLTPHPCRACRQRTASASSPTSSSHSTPSSPSSTAAHHARTHPARQQRRQPGRQQRPQGPNPGCCHPAA